MPGRSKMVSSDVKSSTSMAFFNFYEQSLIKDCKPCIYSYYLKKTVLGIPLRAHWHPLHLGPIIPFPSHYGFGYLILPLGPILAILPSPPSKAALPVENFSPIFSYLSSTSLGYFNFINSL